MNRLAATATATAVALVLLTACGSDSEPEAAPAAPAAPAAEIEPGAVLLATVGTEDEPEAFEISFTDEAGNAVTELAAGSYTVRVNDLAASHNFVMTDPAGERVVETSVPETGEMEMELELTAGTYEYVCDPHPSMNGSVTVV